MVLLWINNCCSTVSSVYQSDLVEPNPMPFDWSKLPRKQMQRKIIPKRNIYIALATPIVLSIDLLTKFDLTL
jgi:hypothetical protein